MLHGILKSKLSTLVLVLVMLVFFVPSCKKSPQQESPKPPVAEPKAQTTAPQPKAQPAPVKLAAEPNTAKPAAAEPAVAHPADWEPIPIVLPKPMFVGTPQSFSGVTNLEKPLGKPRVPFYAPKGTVNVAAGKSVKSSDQEPIMGETEWITNGDKEAADGSYVEFGPGLQHVTIDLGAPCEIYAVVLWHYHKQAKVYFDVIVQVADDADFITNVRTLFNNDGDNTAGLGIGKDMNYVETSEGKLIEGKGVVARYIRCYSNGNNSNDMNNYIEVEAFGRPVQK